MMEFTADELDKARLLQTIHERGEKRAHEYALRTFPNSTPKERIMPPRTIESFALEIRTEIEASVAI